MLGELATVVVRAGEPLWYTGDTRDLPPQVEESVEAYVDESHSKAVVVLPLSKPQDHEETDTQPKPKPEFVGALIRITAQDLAQEQITSFSAYRFLYERLLGAKARPWLPSAFCGAAALPQIRPCRRKMLLQSLSEAAATAPAWSEREPCFYPEKVEAEAA